MPLDLLEPTLTNKLKKIKKIDCGGRGDLLALIREWRSPRFETRKKYISFCFSYVHTLFKVLYEQAFQEVFAKWSAKCLVETFKDALPETFTGTPEEVFGEQEERLRLVCLPGGPGVLCLEGGRGKKDFV